MRYFWLWFVPGLLVATSVAYRIHPIALGAVLALPAQAVVRWCNLRRAARTSAVQPM
jgi:hypothetical protein